MLCLIAIAYVILLALCLALMISADIINEGYDKGCRGILYDKRRHFEREMVSATPPRAGSS